MERVCVGDCVTIVWLAGPGLPRYMARMCSDYVGLDQDWIKIASESIRVVLDWIVKQLYWIKMMSNWIKIALVCVRIQPVIGSDHVGLELLGLCRSGSGLCQIGLD